MHIEAIEVNSPRDIPPALEAVAKRAEVLWGVVDTLVLNPLTAKEILLFSYRNRIPFVGLSAAWVKSGALYALEPDYADIGAQCADVVTRILQGARPASIPVAGPRKVTYSINQRTATHMKLGLSAEIVRGARETF